jgi:hypothetical protein
MLQDERLIIEYLQTLGDAFASAAEICRRAPGDKRRWKENPNWAKPTLIQLVNQGILESNAWGQYRLKPEAQQKRKTHRSVPVATHVATHIQKILSGSGRVFDLTELLGEPARKKRRAKGDEPEGADQSKPETGHPAPGS